MHYTMYVWMDDGHGIKRLALAGWVILLKCHCICSYEENRGLLVSNSLFSSHPIGSSYLLSNLLETIPRKNIFLLETKSDIYCLFWG